MPKLAINAGAALDARTQAVYRSIWIEGLGDLEPTVLLAAFRKTLKECVFWPIKVADIRKHVEQAKGNGAEEAAGVKWDEVRGNIRLHYHPDLGGWRGPKISERTRRAINAAGGMAYLSECIGDDLVFARKRFIEAWLRWDELKQDEYLLPDGEVKKLLSDTAQKLSVTHLLGEAS